LATSASNLCEAGFRPDRWRFKILESNFFVVIKTPGVREYRIFGNFGWIKPVEFERASIQ